MTVNVTMDLPTALGLRDNPADLSGYGPLPPSSARALAADGNWRRLICDPATGALLDLGRRRYRPNPALADHIRTRDHTCIFPGCNQRAERCDLDHTVPHRPDGTGGPTSRHNLRALCPRHHRIKHATGWTLTADTTGPPTWTSPLGRRYPVERYDYRPSDDTDFDPPPTEPQPPEPEPSDTETAGFIPSPSRSTEPCPF